MLMESPLSSSVETSLLKISEYQDPFKAYDWVSLAGTYQMLHKFSGQPQVSLLEAVPVPDAMNLDESKHPELRVSCPVMHMVSEKPLTSLVYRRRERSMIPGGTAERDPPKKQKHDGSLDDSIIPVHSPGEITKGKNRFNNCLVYNRKRRRGNSSCDFTREGMIRGDERYDAFVSGHGGGETKRRGNRLDNCLVYCRKKGTLNFKNCSFSKHVSGETNISGDQTYSSASSQRNQIVRADGASTEPNSGIITNSSHHPVNSQSRQLAKSYGSFTESHIKETKRNGDVLLVYSRRKQRGKSIGTRINGFLVYSRKKRKVRPKKYTNSTSPDVQVYNALELKDNTQVTEVTCSSDGTNDGCSSLKSSSELASGSSKSGEVEATDCDSSDAEVSETDSGSSSTPFRQCKHCDKRGDVGKMLICDGCEEAYHTGCCGVRMKKVAEIDDWFCPSCLKKKSLKTKIKGRVSRGQKWRVTEPFPIGIRIGKEFQVDVPDWSGPTLSDTCFVGEPLVIDQSEYMHDLEKAKNGKKPRSAVNWLQCREEDKNGDICGKWRRAPRSEVQTKDWECFCCVFWDTSHADCAVPQELETDEILKQLKYIKMLRPRSDPKRRKIGPKGRSSSHKR